MGPTASGKTRLALELARHYPVELISVDSALVYRGLDIGSGKPDKATLAQVPHHLIDLRDPAEAYSAAEFRQDALAAMTGISRAGKIPLLVGGTMLYFKALRDGLDQMPSADAAVRQRIVALAEEQGWRAVHERLRAVDPESADRIHVNDPQRLQRALEVYDITGQTMTSFRNSGTAAQPLPCAMRYLALLPSDRHVLHGLIEQRFRQMLKQGFVEEVRVLKARTSLHPALPALRSVGYRQIWDYLDGLYDYDTMVAKVLAATRQLAKRQLTWLRSWPDLDSLDALDPELYRKCVKLIDTWKL
ncbi:MAG: tRNA (adenosine(37)-N6)-dimethylallyltransferase MiaA [Pseudomonadales bacterium]|nr:tRNA (adenosine(37)-N6)-dimethylallyltransferase MiaA [Pseudomonadales bacterium]